MVSSHLDQKVPDFDEIITPNDSDFKESGLKVPSLIRIGRLAVVDGDILLGKLGQIDTQRLLRIKQKLSRWIHGT
jgi:mRNA interferase MazF